MRTLLAGLQAFKRAPLAIAPVAATSACAGIAILFGLLPASGTAAAAGAVFPLDVYFDVKQALAAASSWPLFVALLASGVAVRSLVLALTLWLADGSEGRLLAVFRSAVAVVAPTAALFLPVAVLIYAGTVIRYAPFIWAAAPIGLGISILRARRAVRLDAGAGAPSGDSTPEAAPFLAYAYVVVLVAAATSFIGERSTVLAALLIASVGPLHALVLLGWRENARAEVYPSSGFLASAATVVIVGMVGIGTFYDRVVRSPAPVGRTQRAGSIAILGGVDSSSDTGALAELDTRSLGYPDERVHALSYTGRDRYTAADTHADPDDVAALVARRIQGLDGLEAVVGHSQAALVFDRMLAAGVPVPASVTFAPLPPSPPNVDVPAADGAPGPSLATALSALLDSLGGTGFDLNAPSSPARIERMAVPEADAPRLAVWALADSVWLDTDWRRPGEVNLVVVSDHVGVMNNTRALRAASDFLAGRPVEPDVGSWRSLLVPVIQYTFAPWRPETG